jgi:hypothetical protein
MSRFVPHPMDTWAAEHGAALLYPDGQEVREGDVVDFGERKDGEVFYGTVLRCSIATAEAVVAISGSRRYPVSKLTLAGRKDEEVTPTT